MTYPSSSGAVIGIRVRQVRTAAGMSQLTLSDLSGVPRQVLAKLETAQLKTVSTDRLVALAHALSVPCRVLDPRVCEHATPDETRQAALLALSDELRALSLEGTQSPNSLIRSQMRRASEAGGDVD